MPAKQTVIPILATATPSDQPTPHATAHQPTHDHQTDHLPPDTHHAKATPADRQHHHLDHAPAAPPTTAHEPDIIDRMFDYLARDPILAQALATIQADATQAASTETPPPSATTILDRIKQATRDEFGGDRPYIRRGTNPTAQAAATHATETGQRVLQLFNGRNATQVARTLGIGRSTVYRYLRAKPKK